MSSALGSSNGIASKTRRALRGALWVLLAIVIGYIGLVIYRIPAAHQERISQDAVAKIQAQKLTMDDVDGRHLPPPPDPAQADATIAGIDANQNGIRDDVELAIFAKYPTSTAVRAAELQYAMELQMMLTQVSDSGTWTVAAFEQDRGYQCIGQTYPRTDIDAYNQVTDARVKEVEGLVFNNSPREEAKNKAYNFETSFELPNTDFCDLILQ